MSEILTPGVIQAALGLATAIATGLFALYLKKYGDEKGKREEAEAQGDLILNAARRAYNLIKALCGTDPNLAPYLKDGEAIIVALEAGWADAKTRTPEMEEYYDKLIALLEEIGKARVA